MMMIEVVPETSVSYRYLTWLIAREGFIEVFETSPNLGIFLLCSKRP